MAKKIFGIDFGTNAIKVYKKGDGIVLSERTALACVGGTAGKEKRAIAIGEKAYEMYEKAPPSIYISLPISRGVIAHLDDMVSLWNYMGKRISGRKKMNHCQFYIAVPADITEVEKQAYSKIITKSETKPGKVCLIDKPLADAFGLGLDVEKSRGIMIVNFGADTTEISVLSLGGIVVSKLLPYGGNDFDRIIQTHLRKNYNFIIGLKTAEQAKKQLICVEPKDLETTVAGTDVLRGLPGELKVSSKEIHPLIKDIFHTMATEIRSMLEHTPPEISSEIRSHGIYLTGGTSLIPGLDQFLANWVNVQINTTKNALNTVASGMGYFAEHPKLAAHYAVPLQKANKESI